MRGAYLKTAHQRIIDLVLEELRAFVLDAGPTPQVLVLAVVLAGLEDTGCDCPHDHAEDEPAHGEKRVVHANLLRPVMTAAAVTDKNTNADEKRDAGAGEDDVLRPGVGAAGPGRKIVHGREMAGGVEDGKRGRKHGEDDETAAEVDTAEGELGHAYTGFDFLWFVSYRNLDPNQEE